MTVPCEVYLKNITRLEQITRMCTHIPSREDVAVILNACFRYISVIDMLSISSAITRMQIP